MDPTNDYDKACRYAAKRQPAGLFGWLLPGHEQVLAFAGWVDTRRLPFPGEPDRTCDTVARFRNLTDPRRPWYLVVEFQSHPERWMLLRLLQYQDGLLWELRPRGRRGQLPHVGGVLVNLTGRSRHERFEMILATNLDVSHRYSVRVRNLAEESAAQTLDAIAAGRFSRCILPWVPLMHGGADSGIIQQWLTLAEGEPDQSLRSDYAALAVVFAALTGSRLTWGRAVEEWSMRRNWKRSEVFEEMRVEGRLEARREALLEVLQARFDTVPEDIATAVAEMTDVLRLSRWLRHAARAKSLDAFRSAVRLSAANGPHA
jgi:hypothetical protein